MTENAELDGVNSVGKRRRRAPARLRDFEMENNVRNTQLLSRTKLEDSENKLSRVLRLLEMSESMRAENEIEMARINRHAAEWRDLYYLAIYYNNILTVMANSHI